MTAIPTIGLPWPPSELSPNGRRDRRATTRARAKYREAGFYAAKEAKVKIPADALLWVTFCPPDRIRRDLDNLLGRIKYGLDGIAKASGVDDYGWSFVLGRGEPVKGGLVLIEVAPPAVSLWRSIGDLVRGFEAREAAE